MDINTIDYLKFLEPTDKNCTDGSVSKISVKDAIASSKKATKRKNYTYKSDEDALWDFVAEHWTQIILKKGGK